MKKGLLILFLFSLRVFGFSFFYNETGKVQTFFSQGEASVFMPNAIGALPGEPDLPVKIVNIALPIGKKCSSLKFTVDSEPLAYSVFVRSVVLNSFDNPWAIQPIFNGTPPPVAQLIRTGFLFGIPIAQIKIFPVSYEPATRALFFNRSFHFDLTLIDDTEKHPAPKRLTPTSALIRRNMLENLVANPEDLPPEPKIVAMDVMSVHTRNFPPAEGDDPADGIIIAEDRFAPILERLKSEIAFGVILEIVPLSSVMEAYPYGVDRAERMRKFVVDAYEKWGISGVFIVGGYDEMPIRYRSGYDPVRVFTSVPSDLYFCAMDGSWNSDGDLHFGEEEADDFLPELFASRFQPEDSLELISFLAKIRFHRWFVDREFCSRWLFAGASLTSGALDRLGQFFCESIIGSGLIPSTISITRMYSNADSTGGDIEFKKTNFLSSLNRGQYIICHIDHGYQYIIHTGKITDGNSGLNISEMLALRNAPYFPLLYTFSCEVNAFDLMCVGSAAVRSRDGGFIGIIAHSRPAWTTQMYTAGNAFWQSSLLARGRSVKLGEVMRSAICAFPDDPNHRYYKAMTNLIGYPFLDYNIGKPSLASLYVSPETLSSTDRFIDAYVRETASGAPLESVLVVAHTSTGRYGMARTDHLGFARIWIGHGIETEIYITASGGGILAVAETIPVIPSGSPHVIAGRAIFRRIGGDMDNCPEPGDTFACDLTIHNRSASIADSIKIITRLPNIIDSIASCARLNPGDSITIPASFTFSIDRALRGNRNLRPIVAISHGSSSSIDTLSVLVYGPVLNHFATDYIDGEDGLPELGERALFSIGVRNDGLGSFKNCEATIALEGALTTTTHLFLGDLEYCDSVFINIPVDVYSSFLSTQIILTFDNTTDETLFVIRRMPTPPNSPGMIPYSTSIELYWNPPDDTTVIGYNVYRKQDRDWVKITNEPVGFATYIDDGLPERSYFYYRITSFDRWSNESPPSDSIFGWTTLPFLAPWPKSVGGSVQIYATPLLVDLNRDGRDEIIVAGKNYAAIWIFNSDGTDYIDLTSEIDPFFVTARDDSVPALLGIWGSPAIGDVDGDGILEILVNDRHGSRKLHLISTLDATELPGWPRSVNSASMGTPALADIDGDMMLEIINPTFNGIEAYRNDGQSYVPGGDGRLNALEPGLFGVFWSSPAIGDINRDGNLNIIMTGPRDSLFQGTVWAFDHNGNVMPGWPIRIPDVDFSIGSPIIANFDTDTHTLEIFVPARVPGLFIFDYRGNVLSGWPVAGFLFPNFVAHGAVADFDGDGVCEIVASGSNRLALLRADGSFMPGWPIEIGSSAEFCGNPTIADVDGDGQWEILYSIENRILGFKVDGRKVAGFPLILADAVYSAPVIGDIDGDGKMDIVTGCFDSRVYVWTTNTPYYPSAVAWPTQRGNNHRTGLYGEHWAMMSIQENRASPPDNFQVYVIPNPFNSTCRIFAPDNSIVEIFDIIGNKVATLPIEKEGNVIWRAQEKEQILPSGIYWVKAKSPVSGETISSGKVIFIK